MRTGPAATGGFAALRVLELHRRALGEALRLVRIVIGARVGLDHAVEGLARLERDEVERDPLDRHAPVDERLRAVVASASQCELHAMQYI